MDSPDTSYTTMLDDIKEYFNGNYRLGFMTMYENEKFFTKQQNTHFNTTLDYTFDEKVVDDTCSCEFYKCVDVPEHHNTCLYLHNHRRCAEGITPLKWSYELEGISKAYGRLYAEKSRKDFGRISGISSLKNLEKEEYQYIINNDVTPNHIRIPIDPNKNTSGPYDYIIQNISYAFMPNGVLNIKNIIGSEEILKKYFKYWKNTEDITLMDYFCASADNGWYVGEDVESHSNKVGSIENHRYPEGIYNHLTQMMWEGTKYIGCGVALHPSTLAFFGSCHYYPAGNFINKRYYDVPPPNPDAAAFE